VHAGDNDLICSPDYVLCKLFLNLYILQLPRHFAYKSQYAQRIFNKIAKYIKETSAG